MNVRLYGDLLIRVPLFQEERVARKELLVRENGCELHSHQNIVSAAIKPAQVTA